jgi:hypothetical protein
MSNATKQAALWDPPGSKPTDPLPSYLATEVLKGSEIWHCQLWAVYHGLRANQGLAAMELTERLGLSDKYIASRRLPELRDRFQLVCNGQRRRCRVSKRLCQTWWCSRRYIERSNRNQPQISAPTRRTTETPKAGPKGSPSPTRHAVTTSGPHHVTSPQERRRLLEEMAKSDPKSREVLDSLHRGEGGAK